MDQAGGAGQSAVFHPIYPPNISARIFVELDMSALANHAFIKMNGLGNEIVIVDMRSKPALISADDARAAAPSGGRAL